MSAPRAGASAGGASSRCPVAPARRGGAWVGAAALLALAGCLDPLVDDTPPRAGGVLPAGTAVTPIDDDPEVAEAIEEHDGVEGVVPLLVGFRDGAAVRVRDFGVAPAFAAPVYSLVRRTATGVEPVGHNNLIDRLPGEPGYSPFWAVFLVHVTDRYAGELITSVAAIDVAIERGLVEPPEAQDLAVNCPVVGRDVTVEVGDGNPPLAPAGRFYIRGHTVAYYGLGAMPLIDHVAVPDARRYVLRREGGEPLNEQLRGVDMTGDGDLQDSNDVYGPAPGGPPSPLYRTVMVAVPAATASIDTTGDETMADLRAAEQLFAPGPVPGTVIGYQLTDELRNRAAQRMPGGL